MTASVLSAGDGYMYYTNSIATGDVHRAPGTELTDYYTADGNPPGVWIGAGTHHLGVQGQVSEAQMRALFGEGLHPNADAITAELAAAGKSEKEIADAIKLGRSFYKFGAKDSTLKGRVDKAYLEFERLNGRAPDRDERRQVRMREGAIVFRDVHNRPPASTAELAKYVTAAMKPAQQAVAGVDFTFSPPKSVSVLWALGDRATSRSIEDAVDQAIADTIRDLERDALATRAGVNGVRQIDVDGGIIATSFRHHESRTGDPQLHTHVVIANKVKGVDGTWRSLDSKLLLRRGVALSERFNMHLFDRLDRLGFTATERTVTAGKAPVLEIGGISDRLIDAFSTRNKSIKQATDRLVDAYAREHGRTPTITARLGLSAQAWQETRPRKERPRSIAQLREETRARALTVTTAGDLDATVQHTRAFTRTEAALARLLPPMSVHTAADEITAAVERSRSTWGAHHMEAEVTRWISRHRYRTFSIVDGSTARFISREDAHQFLLRTTLQLDSIKVTPEHVHGRFQPLTRTDGESYYVSKGHTLYTSTRVLEAENRLLQAATTTAVGPAAVTREQFAAALAKHPNTDAAQVRLAREFVTNRTQLMIGIGPAGAGKTRSMRLAAAAVQEAGGRMIGLAPSKQAAGVFAKDVGVQAFTIDAFLTAHHNAQRYGTDVPAKFHISAGDIVVVDEGAMAATSQLDAVNQIVAAADGFTRPLGDHGQLSSPGAGGAFRLIANDVGAVELETIYRFTNKAEAEASKTLRESAPSVDPFAWYKDNGRIIAAPRDEIVDVIFTDYLTDLTAGRESIMGAPTRELVDELNARAQAHHIGAGTVYGRRSATLNDGQEAHTGDRIMTRLNQAKLTMNQGRDSVANGDLYTVTDVHRDGSLTVTHDRHHGTIRLPAKYVREQTHLGYAFTAHQEQGDTIGGKNTAGVHIEGVSRGIVTATTARANAYVLATRGTDKNVLYVEVEPGQHPDEVLATIAGNIGTNLSAHEMIDVESARMHALPRLVDEHADVVTQANAKRLEGLARRVLGPETAKPLIASKGWEAAAAGLARAEKHALDPDKILARTWTERGFGDADDIGAVMSWRIEGHLETLETNGAIEPLPEPGLDTGTFEWAVDRTAQHHPDLPEEWRDHLAERVEHIDQQMTLRGVWLAAEQPAWTVDLGAVPADPERHQEWMRLAAEVDLFRDKFNVPADEPTAIPKALRDAPLGKNLAARVTALHKSTAIREARGTATTAAPDVRVQMAAKLATKAEQHRPRSEAERAVQALNPAARSDLMKRLEQLRAQSARTTTDVKATHQAATSTAQESAAKAMQREQAEPDRPSYDPTLPTTEQRVRGPRL
ncbi:MobF family relaxase [Plantibacter sp. CFBP 8804]|uniref:MobF family relaxase n=1 Tax=Plantibacter sp. CFBP 8804 TaxID=2775270 RepID=UPI0017836E72|nr:MobF family relaxase [Plantibacter sp. CFBP 8804]MBD8519136.1 relaxase domain-containing protein [Plantibacter sp. CFBP 8804]